MIGVLTGLFEYGTYLVVHDSNNDINNNNNNIDNNGCQY